MSRFYREHKRLSCLLCVTTEGKTGISVSGQVWVRSFTTGESVDLASERSESRVTQLLKV